MPRNSLVAAVAGVAAGGFLALSAPAVLAQSGPSLALDATTGGGMGRGGEFRDRSLGGARLAVSVRGPGPRRVAPYAELAMDWLSIAMGHDALCYPSARGGCIQSYPELAGPELTVGVLVRRGARVEVRGGVGGGAYGAGGTWVGGVLGQLDVAAFPVRHVGIVAGARAIVVPRYRGDRLWTVPWVAGLRVR